MRLIPLQLLSGERWGQAPVSAFAPGHLGELTQVIPFELVDGLLADTRAAQRRVRLLPSRVGVYFVLALGLFPRKGYRGVWAELTAALDGLGLTVPCPKALRDLRRLGAAPFRLLFEALAGPAAWPRTPGVRFGRYRTVSFDGCKTIKVPDTARNRAWLGKMIASNGETGYPVIQLMTLAETGTRALIGAVFGSTAHGEVTWARRPGGNRRTIRVRTEQGKGRRWRPGKCSQRTSWRSCAGSRSPLGPS
jgi:hypothetical protein